MTIRCWLLLFFIFAAASLHAQTAPSRSRQTSKGADNSYRPGPTQYPAESPYKTKNRWWRKRTVDPVKEYYERMEDVAKAYKKAERLSRKPQYSNPLYFGHKRPPKKHSPGKMRYCKECGIRH